VRSGSFFVQRKTKPTKKLRGASWRGLGTQIRRAQLTGNLYVTVEVKRGNWGTHFP